MSEARAAASHAPLNMLLAFTTMPIDEVLSKRFAELDAQIGSLHTQSEEGGFPFYKPDEWQQWATSAHHLLGAAFGKDSPHFVNFEKVYRSCKGWEEEVSALKGIFKAARADYDSGYAFSMQAAISGEIFGDFLALAKNALSGGAKDVAAVLACAALEDALKRFALMNDVDVSNKVMQDVVNTLKAKGLVGGAQKSLLDAMPKIRDFAMHANWDKLTEQDVGSVIGFTEQFLVSKF